MGSKHASVSEPMGFPFICHPSDEGGTRCLYKLCMKGTTFVKSGSKERSFMKYLQTLLLLNQCAPNSYEFPINLRAHAEKVTVTATSLNQKKKERKRDMEKNPSTNLRHYQKKKKISFKTTCCLLFLHTAYS